MRIHEFRSDLWLPCPLDEIFSFFADAGNLELLTPPWMRFHILTPRPIEMRPGTRIDYQLRIRLFPVRWQSEITAWEPPHHFVDEQRHGPYRVWRHEHTFEPRDGGTICRDIVRYAVPFDTLTHRFIVRPDIERIFAFRQKKMSELFAAAASDVKRPVV